MVGLHEPVEEAAHLAEVAVAALQREVGERAQVAVQLLETWVKVRSERRNEDVDVVLEKRDGDGRWPMESPRESPKWDRSGQVHFEMEEGEGKPSRWNTLRALRVLSWSGHSDR